MSSQANLGISSFEVLSELSARDENCTSRTRMGPKLPFSKEAHQQPGRESHIDRGGTTSDKTELSRMKPVHTLPTRNQHYSQVDQ